jgi:hypothetical protein
MQNRKPYLIEFMNSKNKVDESFFIYTDKKPEDAVKEELSKRMSFYRPECADVYEGNWYDYTIKGAFIQRIPIPFNFHYLWSE